MKKQFTLLLVLGLAFLSNSLQSQSTEWVSISMDKHYANNGDVVAVPVRCYNMNGIVGLQYVHTWDSTQLKVISVTPVALLNSGVVPSNFNLSIPGKLFFFYSQLDLSSNLTLPDSSILYTISFLVLNNQDTAHVFTNLPFLSPTVPAAIENLNGENLFNAEVNQPASICPIPSATEEPVRISSVSVMPNPFYDRIILENTLPTTSQFELCAADGTVAFRGELVPGQNTFSTAHLPAGFYFWRIIGAYAQTGKLVKRQ